MPSIWIGREASQGPPCRRARGHTQSSLRRMRRQNGGRIAGRKSPSKSIIQRLFAAVDFLRLSAVVVVVRSVLPAVHRCIPPPLRGAETRRPL
jgi:hypothetical protein